MRIILIIMNVKPSRSDVYRAPGGVVVRLACLVVLALCACSAPGLPAGESTAPPAPLRFYDWAEDIPQEVFAAFSQQSGIPVEYLTYDAQEDAFAELQQGESFDVVVMDARFLPLLIEQDLLSPLDHSLIPNFRYIAPNFRDLAYDPGNRYSVPFNWGVTGLVVRSEFAGQEKYTWADLWDAAYAGKVGVWFTSRREMLGMALRSLGYSANSEDPDQLLAAQERISQLLPQAVIMEDYDPINAAAAFQQADLSIAMAFGYDYYAIQDAGIPVEFVLPQDGSLLWNDTFVVPASSPQKTAAMQLINFIHQPEISAQIANFNGYATPNQGALPMIDAELLADVSVYPSAQDLALAEIILPLSVEGQALHDRVWEELARRAGWELDETAP